MTPRLPTNRRPITPGEILNEEFLKPLDITQTAFAHRIDVPYARLNEIVHDKRAVTVDTALRLSRALGTTPGFWMNLQQGVDLYDAIHSDIAAVIHRIEPVKLAAVAEGVPQRA
jgi:addiction module HigA family antidote